VGFGISSPEQATKVCEDADGAIMGSAIVKIIEKYGDKADEQLKEFLSSVASAVHGV
jgi:tryptophan synthase alpha chain